MSPKRKLGIKIWQRANREKVRAATKRWRVRNAEKLKAAYKEYNKKRIVNKELYNVSHRAWRERNREHCRAVNHSYRVERLTRDPSFKLAYSLRRRLRNALKGRNKFGSAIQLLGCSVEEARLHIERQFKSGMTWDNWSFTGWHVDHIKPIASFDLADPAQQAAACHYTNLQPLWWMENLSKGAR